MRELIFRQAEDGPQDEQCARRLGQRPGQVVLGHAGESFGRGVGCFIRREEVFRLVERCPVDVRKVRRQIRGAEPARVGGCREN